MATGDITAVRIAAEGWYAEIEIEGFATGATYDFGWAEGNVPTAKTPYFTVVSEGFGAAGNTTTVTRTIYATIQQRKPYPDDAQNEESVVSGKLVFQAVLSEFVYDDDRAGGAGTSGTDPVFTAPAGWVKSGATPSNAVAAMAVTNLSTLDYPVPIANWTRPDYERLSTHSLRLGAIGFHASGRDQRPLACVKFTATNGTQTANATVAAPSIDGSVNDANPVIEYRTDLDLTGFTDNSILTANFQAYPIIGDADAVYDSTAGSATAALNKFTLPQTYLLDVAGTRGYPICVVNPAAGSGSGAVFAADEATHRTNAAANPYPTLAKAMAGLSAYLNANHARTHLAGATIYLATGTHEFVNGTEANGLPATDGKCWLTVKPLPGATGVICTGDSGGDHLVPAYAIKLEGLSFTRSSDVAFLQGIDGKLLTLGCHFADTRATASSDGIFDNAGSTWHVRSQFNRVQVGTASYRGCSFPEGDQLGRRVLMLGCEWRQFGTPSVMFLASTGTNNTSDGVIMAYNTVYDCDFGVAEYPGTGTGVFTQGIAVVQNVFEWASGSGTRLLRCAADGNENETHNCVIAHNTVAGELCNVFYQDTPQTRKPHLGHVMILNVTRSLGSKSDDFANDGRCTGNWPVYNGCGCIGNRVSGGSFPTRFRGLYSRAGTGDPADSTFLGMGFTDDRSFTGSGAGAGDYHPALVSQFKHIPAPQMLAWDITGAPRAAIDAAGAYRYERDAFVPLAPTRLRLSPSLFIFEEDFEGTGAPAGWTTDAAGWNFDYTASPLRGTQSLSVTGSTTGTLRGVYTPTIGFPDHGSVWGIYMILRMATVATGGTGRFMEVRRLSDNALQNIVRVNTSGVLSLANGSDAGSTGSYDLTGKSEVHLWLRRNADGSLSGWANTTATHPGGAAMMTGTASNTGRAGNLHIGAARSMNLIVDALRVQDSEIGSDPI